MYYTVFYPRDTMRCSSACVCHNLRCVETDEQIKMVFDMVAFSTYHTLCSKVIQNTYQNNDTTRIRHAILTCAQKPDIRQLNVPHGTNK